MMIIYILEGLIALQHLGFLVLEMFFWTRPLGLKVFRQSLEKAESSRVLAANQGLYNGFLAAGLAFGLWRGDVPTQTFFLICATAAGVFGGMTVNRRIFLVQALPAILALVLLAVQIRLGMV